MAPRWCCHGDTKVLFGVLFLRQTQLAGARDSFGAPLDLEFAKDPPVVSFHRVQGEEEPLDQAWPEYNSRRRWGNVKFSGENWS
jgi:hypothetical protein